ncbi:MAG: DUF362 domain-containing protein [Nitrospinae bacterium]|nr:DUF362 domain-containing protein [Nitrospinota bacterium]
MASKVYFQDDRAMANEDSLVAKMVTLFEAAGFEEIIKPGDTVAIKVHMGEHNNTGYLRPVYVRALVEKVKSLGGEPVVMDTTTLTYLPFPARATALDHLKTVERNGFNSGTVGCPIIIADGYIGADDVRVDLPEGFVLKEQYVATGIALADAMIVLAHFKGHPLGTYGGSIKNMGVGCVSKRGKHNLHLGGDPRWGLKARPFHPHLCRGKSCDKWMLCDNVCPEGCFHVTETSIEWDASRCTGCFACLFVTMPCGVTGVADEFFDISAAAIADSALAVTKTFKLGKIGYLNMAIDISPWCDCVPFSDRPFVPNLGAFSSRDPVAIDVACIDMSRQSFGMPGSIAEEKGVMFPGIPKLSACGSFVGVSENIQTNTGDRIGLGSKQYELIRPEAGDPTKFLYTQVPTGIKFAPLYKMKPVYPEGGFKRAAEVPIEEVR